MCWRTAIAINSIMMREENYTNLIEQTKESFRSDQPMFAPPMSIQLRKAVRSRRKDNGLRPLVGQLLNHRLPVWQAAASVAALFFLALLGWGREESQAPTVYVYLTDTVYKMIPAPVVVPDWSDTVARVLPVSNLDASLHSEKSISRTNMSLSISGTPHSLATTLDTGNLIAFDSSLMRPLELLINHPIRSPDTSLKLRSDSFLQIQ